MGLPEAVRRPLISTEVQAIELRADNMNTKRMSLRMVKQLR